VDRKARGTIRPHGDHYDARVTMQDGTRPWICLPAGETEERAKERAAAMSEMARAPGSTYDPKAAKVEPGETFAAYIARRAVDRTARGLSSACHEPGPIRLHCGRIWERPITAITRDDIEAVVEDLDGEVADETTSAGNAEKVWKYVKQAFDDANNSKTRALRVLTSDPCLGVRGPDSGAQRSKSWLYPSEFLTLVSCLAVPRHHRRVYALAVYLYARRNEIRAIGLEDIDPEHDTVHIHRALDHTTREDKSTKGGRARKMPVEPNVAPLVRLLYAEAKAAGRDHLVHLVFVDWAERFRNDLRTAGITRAELFANDKTRQPIRFHDLRATGITWAGIRGDDPLKIRQRAGHVKFSTTEGYLRTAEVVGPGFGEPFPALPGDLLLPDAPAADPVAPASARRRRRGGGRGGRGGDGGGGQGDGGQGHGDGGQGHDGQGRGELRHARHLSGETSDVPRVERSDVAATDGNHSTITAIHADDGFVQAGGAQPGVLLQRLGDEGLVGEQRRGHLGGRDDRRRIEDRGLGLRGLAEAEHTLDHVVVLAELRHDGADLPVLGEVEAADLRLPGLVDRHRSRLLRRRCSPRKLPRPERRCPRRGGSSMKRGWTT
jgi:integrase